MMALLLRYCFFKVRTAAARWVSTASGQAAPPAPPTTQTHGTLGSRDGWRNEEGHRYIFWTTLKPTRHKSAYDVILTPPGCRAILTDRCLLFFCLL